MLGTLAIPLVLATVLGAAPQDVKGRWYATSGEALAAAKKAQKPVLAVAMDHG